MKESCHFDLRLSEDLLRKLIVISEAEGRTPNNTMLLMLRNYISYFERAKGKLDPAKLRAIDLDALIGGYARELLPGFTFEDVEKSFGLLTTNTGVSIIGLDFDNEGVKAIADSIETTGRLPAELTLPDTLGIGYEGRYTVREVTNPTTGKTFTAVHMGAPYENGDGFVIMTITENEEGQEEVFFAIDFLQIYIEAVRG